MSTFGLHEGFKEKGITSEVRWVVDREAKYLDTGYENNPSIDNQTQLFTMSLEQLEPSLLLPVSLISVSLPCTGHSKSGKSRNRITNAEEHATDATAVFGLMRAVEQVNPSIIVSENVVEARDSATYVLIKSYLSLLGYRVYEVELDNRQSGAFQRRPRYWFVAASKGLPSINLATIPAFEAQYAKLGELMDPVGADDACWAENTYLKEKALRDQAAGKGFSRHLVNEDSEYVTVINRHYGKKQSTPSMIQREDGMERLLTPAEVARSMNCPEELVAGTTKTTAYEGLGQGVDINHARGIAHTLVRDLMGIEHGTAASNVIDPVEFAANDEPDLASPKAATAPGQQLGMF